jgi:hypothetical protein
MHPDIPKEYCLQITTVTPVWVKINKDFNK